MFTEDFEQYNYCQRVKQLLNNANRMAQRQVNVAKRSTQFHKNLETAKDAVVQNQREFEKVAAMVGYRREDIDSLTVLVEEVEKRLTSTKQQNAILELQITTRTAELATGQRFEQGLLESMRTLKKLTNTYINQKELPTRLQGVTLLRGSNSNRHPDQWVPFSFSANDTHGLCQLWQQLQTRSPNAGKWKDLLCIESPIEQSKNTNKEKVATIIDLTSPTSTDCHN